MIVEEVLVTSRAMMRVVSRWGSRTVVDNERG
jgi:hypothetical protein